MNNDIENLLKLLDDDNQQSASLVIAARLKHAPETASALQKLQGTEDPKIRKRVHRYSPSSRQDAGEETSRAVSRSRTPNS